MRASLLLVVTLQLTVLHPAAADEDEDEELLVVGDLKSQQEDDAELAEESRLEAGADGDGDGGGGAEAGTPPAVDDPLAGIIDTALNSPAIFPQRLKVNFGARSPAEESCCAAPAPNHRCAFSSLKSSLGPCPRCPWWLPLPECYLLQRVASPRTFGWRVATSRSKS